MNKLYFLVLMIICGSAKADQNSDDERNRQGRELVQKLSAKVDQASGQPGSVPSLLISQKYRRHLDVQRMTVPSSDYF